MNVFNAETKALDLEIFPQCKIPDLNSGITFIFFVQLGEGSTVKEKAHTHTHEDDINLQYTIKTPEFTCIFQLSSNIFCLCSNHARANIIQLLDGCTIF